LGGILDQVEANSSEHIAKLMQGTKGHNNAPVTEFKMEIGDSVSELRKQFVAKKLEKSEWQRV
jgi:hypothetical protein